MKHNLLNLSASERECGQSWVDWAIAIAALLIILVAAVPAWHQPLNDLIHRAFGLVQTSILGQ